MENGNDNEIKQLKIALYRVLLRKGTEKLTDKEIDLAYHLSRDEDIQELFDPQKEKIKKEG